MSLLLILQTLSKSEPLSLYCIQAQELICYQANGLLLLSKEENKEFIISELDRCLKGLHTIAEAAAAAAAAAAHQKPGKEVKKDDKGKKGADHGHAQVEVLDYTNVPSITLLHLSLLKTLSILIDSPLEKAGRVGNGES